MEFDDYAEALSLTQEQRVISMQKFGGGFLYIPRSTHQEREKRDQEILALYKKGITQISIGKIYQISQPAVSMIIYKKYK